jgi:hypothetical protein
MRTSIATLGLLGLLLAACGGGADDDGGNPDGDLLPAEPFADAAERAWTWFPIEGNQCMDGSDTGVAVSLARDSGKLAIVFEGGGACFNPTSCSGVAHQDGFGQGELDEFIEDFAETGIFDRADEENPLADWNLLLVPYCTGDIHAAALEDGVGGRTQVGYRNVQNILARLETEYAAAPTPIDQVLVTGISAGGFGATYNYAQIHAAYDGIPVDLLNDSGPPVSSTYLTPCFEQAIRDAWQLDDTFPTDCEACEAGGIGKLVEYYSETYDADRQGYIGSLTDDTIRQFIAFGYPDCEDFDFPMEEAVYEAAVTELRDDIVDPLPNAAMFTIGGGQHVFTWGEPLGGVVTDGSDLAGWITGLVEDADGWDNVDAPPTE